MKKIIVLMMAMTMLFALSVVASAEITITTENIELDVGTDTAEVEVPLYIDGISEVGVYGLQMQIAFNDTDLVWTALAGDDGLGSLTLGKPKKGKYLTGAKFSWDGEEPDYDGGLFATLTFDVPVDAAAVYEITLNVTQFYDGEWEEYEFDPIVSTITVKS